MYTFDIGIITFDKRFDSCFVPLVKSIRQFNQDSTILTNINGSFKAPFNEEYRKRILRFMSEQDKIFPFIWTEFRGLSKLWNNCILNTTKEYILILNDDMTIKDQKFFDGIQEKINEGMQIFSINNGFSIYVISKTLAIKVGFFDERFLVMGNEDTDFCVRYGQIFGRQIPDVSLPYTNPIYLAPLDPYEKGTTKTASGSMFNERLFKMIMAGQVSRITEGNLYPCEEFYLENKESM